MPECAAPPGDPLSILKSYLSERTQWVIMNNKTSKLLPLAYGVPQGSILGPILFSIDTSNITFKISDKTLEMVKVYKYLGIFVDNKLNFHHHNRVLQGMLILR